jgi:integrase
LTEAKGLRAPTGQSRNVLINQGVIDRAVKAQRAEKKPARRVLVDDACPGLRLVLNPGGSSAWTYIYRPRGTDADGKRLPQRTMALGDLTTLTPVGARASAEAAKAAVRNGKDPAAERKAVVEAERLARLRQLTVGEAAKHYKAAALSGGTLHHEREASHLALAIGSEGMDVADTPLTDLTRADVFRLLNRHTGHPGVARHRFGALSRCLDWHVEHDALSVNPCSLVGRKYRPKRPKPRQRVYTATEMQTLWQVAEKLDETDRDYLRLMMLMPLRRHECSDLTSGNLDKGRGAIVLHGVLTKNGDAFTLPLPPVALAIVERRIAALGRGGKGRLFQFNSTGEAMNAWGHLIDRVEAASGIEEFKWHDLRRTFMTELAEHNIGNADTLDACLNHRQSATRSGVRAAYNHATLTTQKVSIMNAWGDLVARAVVSGTWPRETKSTDKVVPMLRAAAE